MKYMIHLPSDEYISLSLTISLSEHGCSQTSVRISYRTGTGLGEQFQFLYYYNASYSTFYWLVYLRCELLIINQYYLLYYLKTLKIICPKVVSHIYMYIYTYEVYTGVWKHWATTGHSGIFITLVLLPIYFVYSSISNYQTFTRCIRQCPVWLAVSTPLYTHVHTLTHHHNS